MRTSEDYRQALYKMKPNIIIDGKYVGRDDPRLQGAIKTLSLSFDKIDDPEFKDLLTAESHITGESIHRFTHIHQTGDDL
ncbi:MAG: 4-hydroxyphenylacetate 3-hydroxylase N-terminal domain-containing protein, partial [Candidatus Thorarchaeota archaeon]